MRVAEIERLHSRLGTLTSEQLAAVEALTRGLVNKFLHQPMAALKRAAREGDGAKLDALCEEWSVSSATPVDEIESKSTTEIKEPEKKKTLEKVS